MTGSTFKNFAVLVLVLAGLAACAPAKNPATSARPGVGTELVPSGGSSVISCHGNAGRIYDAGGTAASFESRVKALLSATATSSLFGTIDGSASSSQTCVGLEGHLALDASGNISAATSRMKISVYDSLAANGAEEAYVINFAKATSASVNGNSYVLQFADDYGVIQFTIDLARGTSTGTVTFQNYKHVDNATPASGNLGTFAIPTASFAN